MSRVLIVEDSMVFSNLLKKEIETKLGMTVALTKSLAETEKLLNDMDEENFFSQDDNFFVAILDLNLPDAPSGKIVDFVRSKSIPAIVFTAECDDKIRELIWSKEIVDYVYKRGKQDVQHLVSLIRRISLNRSIKILVVDDSKTTKMRICNLLEIHHYTVLQANSGVEALKVLQENPDITLVLTDYEMPIMDGFALTHAIREKHDKNDVAVIGISANDKQGVSVGFLKNGANDFLKKPFLTEEFYCRVTQNVEIIESLRRLKQVERELNQLKEKAR